MSRLEFPQIQTIVNKGTNILKNFDKNQKHFSLKTVIRISLIIFVFTVAFTIFLSKYIPHLLDAKPKHNSLFDVALNDTRDDLVFKKGFPDFIKTDGNMQRYLYYEEKLGFTFVDSNLHSIYAFKYLTEMERSSDNIGFEFYPVGWSSESLIEEYGEPTHIEKSDEGVVRVYSFSKSNIFFVLVKNKVVEFGIYNPDVDPYWKYDYTLNFGVDMIDHIIQRSDETSTKSTE